MFRQLNPFALRKHVKRLEKRLSRSIPVDYPPTPRVRFGWGRPGNRWIEGILARSDDRQQRFIETLAAHKRAFERIPHDEADTGSPAEPYWNNPWIPPLDAMALYALLAGNAPATYVEIGSGISTRFARRAIADQGAATRIVSIDPAPRAEVDGICDEVHRAGVEDVDLAIFDGLGEGDVVFFDGSHRCFQNSDVTVFFLEVLPRLAAGVVVGIHDIFWPDDYPPKWLDSYYNEQYVLGAYMLGRGPSFPVLFASAYAARRFAAALAPLLSGLDEKGGGALFFEAADSRADR